MKKMTAKIRIINGLHIGASKESVGIGGIDTPVMKDINGFPYIPGSSLKGKIRSLLNPNIEINNERPEMKRLFGSSDGAGTVIFRDSFLSSEDIKKFGGEKLPKLFEIKMETAIDRENGNAKGGTLRTIERTTTGIAFEMEVLIKSDEDEDIEILKNGFKILENDYLGGMGSRGYGKITIEDLKVENL